MGLKIITGPAGSGKSTRCYNDIRQRLRQSPEGKPLLLIVPEQATFQAERALASTPGLKGFMRAHVLGFRRLAHRVLQETGGAARPYVTELGKRLALRRMLSLYGGELKLLTKAARQISFIDTLAAVLSEFKAYGITPDSLEALQAKFTSTALAAKLTDIALIYREYERFIKDRYTDPEDYLQLLVKKIAGSALVQGAEVWVDGFSWFTPQEAAVLAEILKTAENVCVTVSLLEPERPVHRDEEALFHVQWTTYRKLRDLAASLNIPVAEENLNKCWRFARNPFLEALERRLSAGSGSFDPAVCGFSIAEAVNRRTELEGIARDIISLCREKGWRWRDIAVLLPDPDSYGQLIELVFTDYDIPFFSDRRRPAVHHPLAELLRSALEVISERWAYEPVFRCLKTDLLPLDRDEIDLLENYVLEFGIKGTRWTKPEPWNFVRRLSLDEDADYDEIEQQRLDRINSLRNAAVAPLAALEREIGRAATARDYTLALYHLLERLDAPARLEAWAAAAEAAGDLEQAKEHRQLWGNVVELFEQLEETCGDQAMTLAEYSEVLSEGLDGLTLSLIPPGLDYVTVASLDRTRIENVKAVYIPGVNDGVLPARTSDNGLLGEAERAMLINSGLEIAPGGKADAYARQFMVYTALTRASEYLWLSYPLADEEGKAIIPSLLISRLKEYGGAGVVRFLPAEMPAGCEHQYLVHAERSLSLLPGGLRKYFNGGEISPVLWDVYNWAAAKPELQPSLRRVLSGLFHRNQEGRLPGIFAGRLFKHNDRRLRGSVTRFETYQACPFRHFVKYGLNLKERAVFQLKAPDMGQFFHAVLRKFGECVRQSGRHWGDLSASETSGLCGEIMAELAPKLQNEILLSTGQYRHLQGRLRRTVELAVSRLADFDRVSRFKPLAFEQSFGLRPDGLPPLTFELAGGESVELAGQIDRLDWAEHNGQKYVLIIDYKSGGTWLKLVDVYYGLRLQLLTYLLAVRRLAPQLLQSDDCIPAGILYYFIRSPSIAEQFLISEDEIKKKIDSQMRMPGWVLAEHEVVRLIDEKIQGWSEFLKVALKKDNTFYANCLGYVKTAEQFELLLKHAERNLTAIAQNILAGDITIRPYQLDGRSPCGLCPFGPVCQFDRLLPDNDFRILDHLSDDNIFAILADREGRDKV